MSKKPTKTCLDCQKPICDASTRCRSCACKAKAIVVPPEIRFWKYVDKTPGCWIWIGAKSRNGYGGFDAKNYLAHRFSYEIHFGTIPKGMLVLHRCDRPLCVNPDHLFIGTQKDNMRDMISKGRKISFKGEKNWAAKLKPEDISEIRKLYMDGMAQETIGKKYGVIQQTIQLVCSKKRWSHVS